MNIKQMAESPRESRSHECFSLFQSFISPSLLFFGVFFLTGGHAVYSSSALARGVC